MNVRPIQLLLVEDSPTDVELTREALQDAKIANELHHVEDGEQAMAYLRQEPPYADQPRPDVVMLDLNLPRKDGREVLQEIKQDEDLRSIPVIVLTTSAAGEDVKHAYSNYVNAYIQKPINFDQFTQTVRSFEQFWLSIVTLPTAGPPVAHR
jgi:two-component system, chemotaxis family, response regulator Rcp1